MSQTQNSVGERVGREIPYELLPDVLKEIVVSKAGTKKLLYGKPYGDN